MQKRMTSYIQMDWVREESRKKRDEQERKERIDFSVPS
jgi:hypothetical protein